MWRILEFYMLKKSIFFLAAVLLVGVMVVPYIHAQDYSQMEKELKQVQQDLEAKRITPQQAQLVWGAA